MCLLFLILLFTIHPVTNTPATLIDNIFTNYFSKVSYSAYETFVSILMHCFNKSFVFYVFLLEKIGQIQNKPWITPRLLKSSRQKNTLYKIYLISSSPLNLGKYKYKFICICNIKKE